MQKTRKLESLKNGEKRKYRAELAKKYHVNLKEFTYSIEKVPEKLMNTKTKKLFIKTKENQI